MARFTKIFGRFQRKKAAGNSNISTNAPLPVSDERPALRNVQLPKVKPDHQIALSDQGFTTVTFSSPSDSWKSSLDALFSASKRFFAQPTDYKSNFVTRAGSEEGWSRIDGEKEFITIRSTENCPQELLDAANEVWSQAGQALTGMLASIAESLGLPPEALTVYAEPCAKLQEKRTATMLRLFRYEGHQEKVVAEPHCDLGLLSFVVADTPGLEVWSRYERAFWPIEKTYNEPAGSLLVGRQLERLSNGRYPAGAHRVQAYGTSQPTAFTTTNAEEVVDGPYRYSIVFVLRAHSPVPIDTDALTTEITGPFSNPLKCTAGELFRETKKRHFNINTGIQERDEQKKELKENHVLTAKKAVHGEPESAGGGP